MTPLEFLLQGVEEEASEIIQAASKIKRFTIDSVNPDTGLTNRVELVKEFNELLGVMNLLREYLDDGRGGLPGLHDPAMIADKEQRYLESAKVSRKLGTLVDDPSNA